ncbi:DeoR/GlpR family DNA-binding transcription regulator [Paenibacillus sp. FSL W8-0186]|uniref:DeoR family regulatory proteins n=2 Tax=Paenibacillus TaxID=44249 RepID=A0ABQ4MV46_9BACL|nr:DeoR/GlpR family DNA-binding transcription regulator [Paenibacillus woosongensis]GIP59803.1 DeoR family regulatory proteins [Paenibacillus woosongensis]
MLREERLREIEDMLKSNGMVEVAKLSRLFNVTEMTIRRDLDDLVQRKIAVRSHGGAMLPPDNVLSERSYEMRIMVNREEKEAIAREALALINEGDRVFFDSSTTVYCLAQLISNTQNLLVVTDTLSTANELMSRSRVKVICLGGELQKETGSCAGPFAEQMIECMNFNTAFIGLPRISMNGVLSTSSISGLRIKQAAIQRSKKVVILIDSSKLGDPEFLEVGHLSEVDTVITDSNIDPSFVTYCKSINVNVIIAKVNG